MKLPFRAEHYKVEGTARIEGFSDAFLAIVITLLVLEIHIPDLPDASLSTLIAALRETLPSILTFAFSFLTVAVFWVNHHHFYHEIHHADWRLLWYNMALLFWLSLAPFTTAFLARHPMNPGVMMIYCFVFMMAALSFMLMARHASFVGDLLDKHITDEQKLRHYRRGWVGVYCYAAATLIAPFLYMLSAALILFVPVFFIVPRLMHDHGAMSGKDGF